MGGTWRRCKLCQKRLSPYVVGLCPDCCKKFETIRHVIAFAADENERGMALELLNGIFYRLRGH